MNGAFATNKNIPDFKFAVISDPHIALPHTIWNTPNRFHLVEVSVSALEIALKHLSQLDLDFLLLPGDLTQHGEPENHRWLAERLTKLPFPAYVIPGNHDVPVAIADQQSIGLADFPSYYRQFGYDNPEQLYYTQQVLPGVRLIGLNSNQFNERGEQIGRVDRKQLRWLQGVLEQKAPDELILVTIHHNVLEHLPGQTHHPLGRRYMLDNAGELLEILREAGVQLVLTGHLHVQDVAGDRGMYDITTGSLVSYPHPYRVFQYRRDDRDRQLLDIKTYRIESVPGWEKLPQISREWMGDRSFPFMMRLLTAPPLNLPKPQAEAFAPRLRYFWAEIACGDAMFDFPDFPPPVRRYFEAFSAREGQTSAAIDNHATLVL